MSFYDRDYDVFLVLGGPNSAPLWDWSEWEPFASQIAPFMTGPRGKAAVRSDQRSSGKRVSFGRLGWDNKSHEKWAHHSSTNANESAGWYFEAVEGWAPSWTVCAREDLAPDFYLMLVNERAMFLNGALLFNQRLLCALAMDRTPTDSQSLAEIMQSMSERLSSDFFARRRSTWGVPCGANAFTDAINDLALKLFPPGNPHTTPFNEAAFTHRWDPVR